MHLKDLSKDIRIFDNIFNSNKYLWLHQDYRASRFFTKKTSPKKFKLLFVFDETGLDKYASDKSIFMRALLNVENKDFFQRLNPKEIEELLRETFDLKIDFFNDKAKKQIVSKKLKYEYSISNDGIMITLQEKSVKKILKNDKDNNSKYLNCRIQFNVLYLKSVNRLHVLIAEPTNQFNMIFSYPESLRGVTHMNYCNVSIDELKVEHNRKLYKFKAETKNIIYPRSGVMFFWDYNYKN